MFNDTTTYPALERAFMETAAPSAEDIHRNRQQVIDHYYKPGNRGGDVDEFVMASSLIAGKIMERKEADEFADSLSGADADAHFQIADTIDINSPRWAMEAVMVDVGLLPNEKGRVETTYAAPVEKSPPTHDI